MSDRLTALLTSNDKTPRLLLDAADYAKRVLLQDKDVPWSDATAFSNHLSRHSDAAQTGRRPHPDRSAATGRAGAQHDTARDHGGEDPNRVRNEDNAGRRGAQRKGARSCLHCVQDAERTKSYSISSPKALLITADRAANPDSDKSFDDDSAEFAAVYYADWVRIFAEQENRRHHLRRTGQN